MTDFSEFHEYSEALVSSFSAGQAWSTFCETISGFGFDRALYVSTSLSRSGGWGETADWVVLSSYPDEVIEMFLGEGLHLEAAKVVRPEKGAGAYSWGDHPYKDGRELTDAERQHRELCEAWDIKAGYTVWFSDMNRRRKGVLGMCARPGLSQSEVDAVWARFGGQIQAFANILHLKVCSLPQHGGEKPLTDRQREVLGWIADGKSVQDVAEIMGLSLSTVEKHLRLAREALGAETTANAVHKAASLNQLFLLPRDQRRA